MEKESVREREKVWRTREEGCAANGKKNPPKKRKENAMNDEKVPRETNEFFSHSLKEYEQKKKYFYCFRSRTTTNSMMTKWE